MRHGQVSPADSRLNLFVPFLAEISLAVFPVPASNQLNVAFNAVKNEQLIMMIRNTIGQSVYTDTRQLTAGGFNTILNISNIADGTYFMQLKIDDKMYVRKVTIAR